MRTFLLIIICIWSSANLAGDSVIKNQKVQSYIKKMVQTHDFDPKEIKHIFSKAKYNNEIITLMNRPYEAKPWHQYRNLFMKQDRIDGGVCFWHHYQPILEKANRDFGIPPEIIVAILGVETRYGRFTGRHLALDALTTLAFYYPKRSRFFKKELTHFLLLAKANIVDPFTTKGSYAGALGLSQFMPSNIRMYGVDFSGNGQIDLFQSPADAVGSIANYIKSHGWRKGEPILMSTQMHGTYPTDFKKKLKPHSSIKDLEKLGVVIPKKLPKHKRVALLEFQGEKGPEYQLGFNNFYVITRYNHSQNYARAVVELAEAIAKAKSTSHIQGLGCDQYLSGLQPKKRHQT